MQLLNRVAETIGLVGEAYEQFIESKTEEDKFVNPFIIGMVDNEQIMIELEEYTEACVNDSLQMFGKTVEGFVLAGETQLFNPKTNQDQHFFVIKLIVEGLENSYVYSLPFVPEDDLEKLKQKPLRFAGSEPNTFFTYHSLEGEPSSCNALKMDNIPTSDYRAAFLIGHFDEVRLCADLQNTIADTYCKLAFDRLLRYDFIFEASKFGRMTETMVAEFDRINACFEEQFVPHFPNIKGVLRLENLNSSFNDN
jgi:hypothetical protein